MNPSTALGFSKSLSVSLLDNDAGINDDEELGMEEPEEVVVSPTTKVEDADNKQVDGQQSETLQPEDLQKVTYIHNPDLNDDDILQASVITRDKQSGESEEDARDDKQKILVHGASDVESVLQLDAFDGTTHPIDEEEAQKRKAMWEERRQRLEERIKQTQEKRKKKEERNKSLQLANEDKDTSEEHLYNETDLWYDEALTTDSAGISSPPLILSPVRYEVDVNGSSYYHHHNQKQPSRSAMRRGNSKSDNFMHNKHSNFRDLDRERPNYGQDRFSFTKDHEGTRENTRDFPSTNRTHGINNRGGNFRPRENDYYRREYHDDMLADTNVHTKDGTKEKSVYDFQNEPRYRDGGSIEDAFKFRVSRDEPTGSRRTGAFLERRGGEPSMEHRGSEIAVERRGGESSMERRGEPIIDRFGASNMGRRGGEHMRGRRGEPLPDRGDSLVDRRGESNIDFRGENRRSSPEYFDRDFIHHPSTGRDIQTNRDHFRLEFGLRRNSRSPESFSFPKRFKNDVQENRAPSFAERIFGSKYSARSNMETQSYTADRDRYSIEDRRMDERRMLERDLDTDRNLRTDDRAIIERDSRRGNDYDRDYERKFERGRGEEYVKSRERMEHHEESRMNFEIPPKRFSSAHERIPNERKWNFSDQNDRYDFQPGYDTSRRYGDAEGFHTTGEFRKPFNAYGREKDFARDNRKRSRELDY